MNPSDRKILYCHCAFTELVPDAKRRTALSRLSACGQRVSIVPDLCRMAVEKDPLLRELASGDLLVIACRPRTVRWLFHLAGSPLDESRVEFRDLRAESVECALRELPESGGSEECVERGGDWIPWFPVIDYSRCVDCKQCLSFCLFGVYETGEDGRVEVRNPRHCKTNCPACARICPEVAILFPKYGQPPIDGSEIVDESAERHRAQADLQRMLGENPYEALKKRREEARLRFERDRERQKAVEERERCSREKGDEIA